jgi:hypothetical protein
MSSWSLAGSLVQLRREVDNAFPNRSTISDGTIGDAAHSARQSDHNPDEFHVVRAMDITRDVRDGIDIADNLAEWLRAKRDPRVKYVIFNRRIFSSSIEPWKWRPYSGLNEHTHHVHISVMPHPIGDDGRAWGYDPKEDVVTEADKREIIEGAAKSVVAALELQTDWSSDGLTDGKGALFPFKKAIAEIRGLTLNTAFQKVPAMQRDIAQIKEALARIEAALAPPTAP